MSESEDREEGGRSGPGPAPEANEETQADAGLPGGAGSTPEEVGAEPNPGGESDRARRGERRHEEDQSPD
jgi:hypothetical protein